MSNPFRPVYRELTDFEREQIEQIKDGALALHLLIQGNKTRTQGDPRHRYYALAATALEEAVMWATKAVST